MKLAGSKGIWIVWIGFWMTFQSCSDNATPLFFVDVERDFNVEQNLNPVETHFFILKNIPTNLEQNLEIFGLPEENISTIGPADAVLTTVSGLMDWSFVSWVEIYAVSRVDPNRKEQMFFIRSRDPGSRNELRLFNTLADLSDIMTEETIDLEIRLRTFTSVTGNFRARLLFNYAVFDEI
ncbi:MAG: hypothetical protein AAGA77_24905 [Bacteroidota bacterium]